MGGRSYWHAVSSAGIEISIVTMSFRMVNGYGIPEMASFKNT